MTRSVAGVRLGPGASVYQRIIFNDSCAHDEQGVNPGQVRRKRVRRCPLQTVTVADALISSVNISVAPT